MFLVSYRGQPLSHIVVYYLELKGTLQALQEWRGVWSQQCRQAVLQSLRRYICDTEAM